MKTRKTAAKKPAAKKPAAKKTPDLITVMQKGTGMKARIPRSEMPIKTAAQIAEECEVEAKKLLSLADILRGKA